MTGTPVLPPDGPTPPALLLVHGAGMTHRVWTRQMAALHLEARSVLAVDLPGHGANSAPALDSISAIADWLAAHIAANASGPVIAAGHSMGALAVLALAARHPDKVARLVAVGAGLAMRVHPDLLTAARDTPATAADIIARGSLPAEHRTLPAPDGSSLLDWTRTMVTEAAPGVLHRDLAACDSCRDVAAFAAAITCPTLIVMGGRDKLTPAADGQALAAAITGARTVLIPEAGHLQMLEAPDIVTAALRGHVRG